VTREKYHKRLERFFDFLGLKGANVEVKSSVYGVKAEGGKPMGFQQSVKFHAV
jgi:hypothetical protein